MEDLKSYIESGVLELYVLGDLSPKESLEVQQIAAQHPEVKAELDEIERSMESYAYENAVEPSANQRDKILNSLLTNFADDRIFPVTDKREPNKAEVKEDNVITMPADRSSGFYKYAFAACLALLLVSLGALVAVYKQLQQSVGQVAILSNQNQKFSSTVKYQGDELNVYRDPAVKVVNLKGTPKSPASNLALAWNPDKKNVMIDLASMKLPANDKDHQYQLWAIVAGKPVDLGVFDSAANATGIKEMKPIANAQAFAVTLEKRGGSVNPTMDQMMVIHMM